MSTQIYSGRRQIIWKNVRSVKEGLAVVIATAFGAGLLPKAPGTLGSLAGIPLAYFVRDWPTPWRILFWVSTILLGTWSAKVFDETMGTQDNQNIVIDEVIGLGIAAWTAGEGFINWAVAFCLFRFFDILKPPPVRQVDRWSKHPSSRWLGGFGVIADDIIAGFQALGVMGILQWFNLLN